MGVLMVVTGILVLVLRAWVMHDGGLPDGGMGARYQRQRDGGGAADMDRTRSEVTRGVLPGLPSGADDTAPPLTRKADV